MKKIFALLMAITLLISLCACKKDGDVLSNNESDTNSSADFVKPENYAAVIGLKINPEFELYIDGDENLLALNAVNDDAKAIKGGVDLSKKDIGSVVSAIIKKANESGYVKTGGYMILNAAKVLDSDKINASATLKKALDSAKKTVSDLNIDFDVRTDEEEQKDTTTNTSSKQDTSSKNDTSSKQETSSKEETSSENKTAESKPEENKPAELTVLNPKTNIKMDETKEYIGNKYSPDGTGGIGAHGVSFTEECIILLTPTFVTEDSGEEIPAGRKPLVYNNKKYYRIGAGQSPYYYEITDTEIILKNCFWEEEKISAKMVLLSDGTLKVTYSSIDAFAVGDILSLEWSYLD